MRWLMEIAPSLGTAEWLGVVALVWAAVQFLVAARRDVGAMTVGLVGISVMMAAVPTSFLALTLLGSLLLAVLAWVRAGSNGVGRPAVNGVAILIAAVCGSIRWWWPLIGGSVPVDRAVSVALVPCALVISVAGVLALERPGPRRSRPRWYRKVPIL